MAKWHDLPRNSNGSRSPAWLESLTTEAPPQPRANSRHLRALDIVPAPATKPPPVTKRPAKIEVSQVEVVLPLVDVVEGVYEPVFMFCDDCGRGMFRQFDAWHCWCGRVVNNFAAEHHVKSVGSSI